MQKAAQRIDHLSQMFEAARSYIAGAKIIIASDGIQDDHGVLKPTLPVIILSALAIEIQIKALLIANSIERPKGDGHDLGLLFDALQIQVKNDVIAFQYKETGLARPAFLSLLNDERLTFKTWRYAYEHDYLETRPAELFSVALALNEYLKSSYKIERSLNGWLKADEIELPPRARPLRPEQ